LLIFYQEYLVVNVELVLLGC